jgi:DNA repair exonuclease SbcCD ATPase subunit
MFKKVFKDLFTSEGDPVLREIEKINKVLVKKYEEDLAESYKMLHETCVSLTAERERSGKVEEERDACIKQLIEERDKVKDEANCAWDELNKAKVKALELQSEINRLNENVVRLDNHSSELHAALAAEKEKCEKLEDEKESAWTKLESTEDALEVLNEKMNKEIIEKETALVAWEQQMEKERKLRDALENKVDDLKSDIRAKQEEREHWKSQAFILKQKLKKSEALCREFKNELNFAVSELYAAKALLSVKQEPSNLEIAALIYKQGASPREAVKAASDLREANKNFMEEDAKPKNT